jgi:GNAT superfamily N-acetyltransferase
MLQPITTLAERPELEAQIPRLHEASWPPFIQADPVSRRYWGELFEVFPEYQYLLCDDDQVISAGHTIPLAWDGTVAGLPSGWDGALEVGFSDYEQGRLPNALCGLSIVIAPGTQGQGLSEMMVSHMKTLAFGNGLYQLILPVRPSRKSEHPETPIAEYLTWTKAEGVPFDPWIRVHQRLGAEVLAIAPRSMVVPGTIAEWESWTGQQFPTSGNYPVTGALDPITIDREAGTGLYVEPNVWMRYHISTAS